jgi:3-oxoadipate enol-lactonase
MPTPLVLIHPFPTDAGFWDELRPRLSPDRHVLVPELPGFGSKSERPGWSIAEAADEIADTIAAWAPDGRAAVCGLSMGGYTALALAARRPDVVSALVLADTRAEADDDDALAGRSRAIEMISTQGLRAFLDDFLPHLVAPDTSAEITEALRRIAERQRPSSVVSALEALRGRPDRRDDLPGIACPTLVIVGELDALTPPAAATTIYRGVPGARMATIAGAGHLTALERPADTALLVETFLRGLDRG